MIKEIIEIFLLSFTIFAESSGEPIEGKIAVGCVIRNRVEFYESNYKDVILKPKQFSCLNNKSEIFKHILRFDQETFIECNYIAQGIYYNKIKDNTSGSLYYTTTDTYKRWMEYLVVVVIIDNHKFMKYKEK